ncbi:MAG: hypothetical protein U5L09_08720 [Bacteroidales bacterium]|nr:hypothetical protein [Bacteroidales bacterium]
MKLGAWNLIKLKLFLKKENMLNIKKRYLTNENNQPVAVQVDIETFEKIEQIIEDYALAQLIEENNPKENLTLEEAKAHYDKMRK